MSASDLGKAYVQIIPSAKGIKGSITNTLNGEAESAGKATGLTVAGGFSKAFAAAGVGTAVAKGLKEVVQAGGALEQSLGGIETLFKDNANKVINYANEAYRTTGLSANAYMENVTGFSASLLQSLGGDTAKSAEVANMAMIDMADNSNKMGTSMESIQMAYQGFAKQNYTMLDNLKLGYGGTKSEMERLLADAQKLTGVKYDINNLSDVYEAIHIIQGELGITGTTAQEASETILGSFSAMRAAFQNLLGSLALGQNVTQAFSELASTASTFLFNNLLPMVGKILVSLAQGIVEGIPLLVAKLAELSQAMVTWIQTQGPAFIAQGVSMLGNFLRGMQDSTPGVISHFGTILASILRAILAALPHILAASVKLIGQLVVGVVRNVPKAVGAIINLIAQLIAAMVTGGVQFFATGAELIINAIGGIASKGADFINGIKASIQAGIQTAKDEAKAFVQVGWDIVTGLVQGITEKISAVVAKAKEMVQSALAAARGAADSHSPSRKTIAQGHDFGDGYIIGLKDKIRPASQAAASLVDAALHANEGSPLFDAVLPSPRDLTATLSPYNNATPLDLQSGEGTDKLDKVVALLQALLDKGTSAFVDAEKLLDVTDRGLAHRRQLAERGI